MLELAYAPYLTHVHSGIFCKGGEETSLNLLFFTCSYSDVKRDAGGATEEQAQPPAAGEFTSCGHCLREVIQP